MKDGTRKTYSVPQNKSHKEIYNYCVKNGDIKEEDILKTTYFPSTPFTPESIQYYYNDEKENFDKRDMAIAAKVDEFRKRRTSLFKALDMEFMKSLENRECDECTDHIVKVKEHLRKMPELLEEYLIKIEEVDKIYSFDCFNNIYSTEIINGGSGYETPPKVTVESPNGPVEGMPVLAESTVKDGKVTGITITCPGSGYLKKPIITIEKPQSGNIAIVVASTPENDIFNTNSTQV